MIDDNFQVFIYLQLIISLIYISLSVHITRTTKTKIDDIIIIILIILSVIFGFTKYVKLIKDKLNKYKVPLAIISIATAVISWVSYIRDDCANTYGLIVVCTTHLSLLFYYLFF